MSLALPEPKAWRIALAFVVALAGLFSWLAVLVRLFVITTRHSATWWGLPAFITGTVAMIGAGFLFVVIVLVVAGAEARPESDA